MERLGEPSNLNKWRFCSDEEHLAIKISQALISNDGAIIRQWALAGAGIAYKSIWDVKDDISSGKLVTVLDDFVLGLQYGDNKITGLQLIYPSCQYLPRQVAEFIGFFKGYLGERI